MTTIKTTVTDVTPDYAKSLLSKNTKNRPISDRIVKRYAAMMKKGDWHFNGETVIISENGTLLDGQHRLSAIISSNTTHKMIVVTGVSQDSFTTIDIGNKRTPADALATYDEKYIKHRLVLAAAAQTLWEFDRNGIYRGHTGKYRPTHEELIEFIDLNEGLLKSVDVASNLYGARKLVPKSCLVVCHYLFEKKDEYECEKFFSKLNSGEDLKHGDPVLALRERLIEIRHSGGVFRTAEVIPYVLRAWELTRKCKKIVRLIIKSDYIPQVI